MGCCFKSNKKPVPNDEDEIARVSASLIDKKDEKSPNAQKKKAVKKGRPEKEANPFSHQRKYKFHTRKNMVLMTFFVQVDTRLCKMKITK